MSTSKKLNTPRVITSKGEEIKAGYKRDNLPEGALGGIPVSSGVIEGIARVITDPSNASLNKGEILVAPFTDPGWTPLFINAAGLVYIRSIVRCLLCVYTKDLL